MYYFIAFLIYLILMFMTFSDFRESKYFVFVALTLNFLTSFLWFSLVKSLPDKESILINSVYWDIMIMGIGYILPLFIFSFKLNNIQIISLFVILLGFFMLKVFHD